MMGKRYVVLIVASTYAIFSPKEEVVAAWLHPSQKTTTRRKASFCNSPNTIFTSPFLPSSSSISSSSTRRQQQQQQRFISNKNKPIEGTGSSTKNSGAADDSCWVNQPSLIFQNSLSKQLAASAAAFFTACCLFIFPGTFQQPTPPTMLVPSTHEPSSFMGSVLMPQPAYAATTKDVIDTTTSATTETALDEVWSLVDKYYIDKSFNGQNWNDVLAKYKTKLRKGSADEMNSIIAMVQTLGDKYTRVLDPTAYAEIQKFDLIGVGVTLRPDDSENNNNKQILVGAPPIPGSAADKAGLKVGDVITAINGVSTSGRTAFDIIDQVAEKPDAKTITMTVRKQEGGGANDITMNRVFQKVNDPIIYKITETRKDGTKVGYVRIVEFNSLVKAKLQDALQELEKEGANSYVLDLRMNTGGAFQSAVEIGGLFMENSVATYVVDNNQVKLPFKTTTGTLSIDSTDPIVIWMDGRTASASEVLAGALHDNCRAVTMGDTSFGKGLIQAVYGLKNGAGLVMTVARYVTPTGADIQGIGIKPDIQGKDIVPGFAIVPSISTDTSKIDFADIRHRLDPAMCKIPEVQKT